MSGDAAFSSVWDAIEGTPEAAAHMRLRSDIMMALHDAIESWNGAPGDAAARLGISEVRLGDLLCGRISRFDLDDLVGLADKAGVRIEV